MVWIRRNNVYALLGEIQETQFLGEDDCHPKLYSIANTWKLSYMLRSLRILYCLAAVFFVSKEFMSFCVRSVFPGHRFSFCRGNYFHHKTLNAAA